MNASTYKRLRQVTPYQHGYYYYALVAPKDAIEMLGLNQNNMHHKPPISPSLHQTHNIIHISYIL